MRLWLSHPRTQKPDAMLSLAIWGFIFCTQFASAALYIAYKTRDPSYLANIASICTLILTPTLGAYVGRKLTDSRKPPDKE